MVKKGYNKIELEDGTVLMDFTDTTATTDDVLNGKTFYDKNGNLAEGTYKPPTGASNKITMKASTLVDGMYTPAASADGFRRWAIDATKSEVGKVVDKNSTKAVFVYNAYNLEGMTDIEPTTFNYGNYIFGESNRVKYFTSDGEYNIVTDLVNPKLDLRIEKIYTFSPIGVTSTEHSFTTTEWEKVQRAEVLLVTTQNIADGSILNMNSTSNLGTWGFAGTNYGKRSYSITRTLDELSSDCSKVAVSGLEVVVDMPNQKIKYTKKNTYVSSTSPTMYIYGIMPYHETYGKWF